MGTPCVNVAGLSENGLPLGVQIVGRFGRDRAALEAALFVEQAIAKKVGRVKFDWVRSARARRTTPGAGVFEGRYAATG